MGNLTTKEAVKNYLGITDTAQDTLLTDLIARSSAFIESYCSRSFGEATYTNEIHDGDGISGSLFVRQYPIISVTSLYDDPGRDWAAGTLIASSNYVVYPSWGEIKLITNPVQLDRLGKAFSAGVGNIKVTYVAGYKLPGVTTGNGSPLPTDLELACIELVALPYYDRGRERLGKASQTTGDGGTDSFVQDVPWQIKSVLEHYRKRRA